MRRVLSGIIFWCLIFIMQRNIAFANELDVTVLQTQIEKPIITISGTRIEIKAVTEGSTIYYTTDGSTPTTTNGKKADGSGLTIDTFSGYIKAIAVKDNRYTSGVARKVLLNSTAERNVKFAVKGVFGGRNVTFDSPTKDVKIYYSTTTSTLTTRDKWVRAGETVRFENYYGTIYARTYYNGEWGNVCRLILKIPKVNEPSISLDNKGNAVIRTTTPQSYIYYTTDGSVPSMTNGKRASSSYAKVYIGAEKNISAIAVRSCFAHSKVVGLASAEDDESDISNGNQGVKKELSGKTAIFFGDSITWGEKADEDGVQVSNPYPVVFSNITGAEIINCAVRGATASKIQKNNFSAQITANIGNIENADYCFVNFGVNDFRMCAEVKDGATELSFYADYIAGIESILSINPSIKIITIIPPLGKGAIMKDTWINDNGIKYQEYRDAVVDIAKNKSLGIVDFGKVGINVDNVKVYYPNGYNHLTQEGYFLLGEYLAKTYKIGTSSQ